jgi:poly-gamma-glutamate synthesis protein (capsule biosynthesis protein)
VNYKIIVSLSPIAIGLPKAIYKRITHPRLMLFLGIIFFTQSLSAQDTTRLSLLFAGDIMGHDSQIAAAYNPATKQYEYDYCYQFVKPYLESADLAIGNLELTLAGAPYKGYPAFSSPDQLALVLKEAGFDILVTANNHSCDKGKRGIERTIETLDSIDIPHTGTFTDEASRLNDYPLLFSKNGFKLALLNYTYGTNGIAVPKPTIVNLIDTTQMATDITRAKENAPDFIIAFMHWGSEYQPLPNSYQKKVTEFLFKKGVALVIGAHPHVLQPMEFNKQQQQLVVYSLGNFVSGQRDRFKNGGAMVRVELEKITQDSSVNTTIDSVSYVLHYVHRNAQKKYVILPVPTFESDTTGFIEDEFSKQAFKTFAEDSRALLDKHNKDVQERKRIEALKPEELH